MLISTKPKKTPECDDDACFECEPNGETDVYHSVMDSAGKVLDVQHPAAFLPHSCDAWVIGGPEQVRALIADLQAWLVEAEKGATPVAPVVSLDG